MKQAEQPNGDQGDKQLNGDQGERSGDLRRRSLNDKPKDTEEKLTVLRTQRASLEEIELAKSVECFDANSRAGSWWQRMVDLGHFASQMQESRERFQVIAEGECSLTQGITAMLNAQRYLERRIEYLEPRIGYLERTASGSDDEPQKRSILLKLREEVTSLREVVTSLTTCIKRARETEQIEGFETIFYAVSDRAANARQETDAIKYEAYCAKAQYHHLKAEERHLRKEGIAVEVQIALLEGPGAGPMREVEWMRRRKELELDLQVAELEAQDHRKAAQSWDKEVQALEVVRAQNSGT